MTAIISVSCAVVAIFPNTSKIIAATVACPPHIHTHSYTHAMKTKTATRTTHYQTTGGAKNTALTTHTHTHMKKGHAYQMKGKREKKI